MGNRPKWRTPVFATTSAPNAHLLPKVRTRFGDFSPGSGRFQCQGVSRSSGDRCKNDCVQGANYCRMHGGTRYLEKRIRGPVVSQKSVLAGLRPRAYDVHCAFALDDLTAHLPINERAEFSKLGLGARGRKLSQLAADRGL